jgi:NADPH:quinone reductase
MLAIRVHQFGGPEQLQLEEVPLPVPDAGQVRVKIELAGINFIDIYHRSGRYGGDLPFIPGVEGGGVVDAVGEGVTTVQPGDRVTYPLTRGSYAEYALVSADNLVKLPAEVTLDTAVTLMVQGLTAHYLALSSYPLQPGDTALVHAAAGGVGLLLVQIAKQRGARVIGTVSTPEKAALAQATGADEIIMYTETDFVAETKRLTEGRGVDVIYDGVGQTTFLGGLDCLRPRGYMVLYGQSSGDVAPFNPQILNAKGSLFLTRPSLGHYLLSQTELQQRAGDLFGWLAEGTLTVRIDQTFALSEAAVAHRYLENRQSKGKLLLATGR